MLDPTHVRWKRLAVSGWEIQKMQKMQIQLGQHAVLPLPRYGGCDVIASLPDEEL
jgi:hypothetical protein